MKGIRWFICLGFSLLVIQPAMAQRRDLVAQADKVFAIGEYYRAIEKYNKAYTKEKDKQKKTEIRYKTALCYYHINNMKRAESYLSQVLRRKYPDPKATLLYADVLKINGKFDESKAAYEEYLKNEPTDQIALLAYQTVDSILSWTTHPTRYLVENMKDFNGKDNDFSPCFASDDYRELYFTSSREGSEGNKIHGGTGESFADIFMTRLDNKQKWSVPTPLEKTINTQYDDGTPWISPDGGSMYFTRCRFDKNEELGCQILYSTLSGNKWSEPVIFPIAADSVVVAHPALTKDLLTMYFVSDMLGGEGGKDIWKVTRENESGQWGEPYNLGSQINTARDEMFPFIKSDSLFYFSSDGHPGMGGLDIFQATLTEDGKWRIENMKYPINSTGDDFGIVFQHEEERGYFTSNRTEEGRGGDDIYSFVLPQKRFSLTGLVLNEKTENAVDKAEVRLIGSDGNSLEYTTDSTGKYSFRLNEETDYIIVAFKKGYLNGKVRETTKGLEDSREFNANLVLSPIEKPIELPNILYDLAKWDLRPESMVALDALIETLEDNPNITIELMSHTDVRPFRTMSNLELSQLRAQSVVDYLITRGIDDARLEARGYGPEVPRVVDEKIAGQYDFLSVGDTLTKEFIESLKDPQIQEIAHQLNRRTEFKVLSTDYVPKDLKDRNINAEEQLIIKGQEELKRASDFRGKKGDENQDAKLQKGIGKGGG